MASNNKNPPPSERLRNYALALTAAQGGCASVIVVFVCLLAGLALDNQLKSQRIFTLVFILASVPLSLYVMLQLVLGATRRITPPEPPESKKEDRPWQEKD
jgi:hypothetical protein